MRVKSLAGMSFLSFTLEPCIQVGVRAAMPPCEIANPRANTKLLIAINSNFFTTKMF